MKTQDIIARINAAAVVLGQKQIKAIHTKADGIARMEKLEAEVAAKAPKAPAVAKAPKAAPADRPVTTLARYERGTQGIGEAELRRVAPAVFATAPDTNKVSERYQFVNSWELLKPLLDDGYVVTQVQQKTPRAGDSTSMAHTRHLLRLRPAHTGKLIVGDTVPEIVFINGHAGQTRVSLLAGLFRLVCANGLIIASQTFGAMNVKHTARANIAEEAAAVIANAQKAARTVEEWTKVQLSKSAMFDFAKAAANLAYGEEADQRFDPATLLAPRREADKGNDLWRVFNRVQENVMRGGVDFTNAGGRAMLTRGVTNMQRGLTINAGLWSMADELAVAVA
jgi:hypothetical protein